MVPNQILTARQEQLIRTQIRRNSSVIDLIIGKIDLLANRERCPRDANTLLYWRRQLVIEIEENDNFRKVLWKHMKAEECWRQLPGNIPDPISFLVNKIRLRQKNLIAEACWK